MFETQNAKFFIGQLVHHKLFGYRGVVVDVDCDFQGEEQWYNSVAKTRPPKDKPWYHVLVDEEDYTTYVAERNLEPDDKKDSINHPLVAMFFHKFENGTYISDRLNN